MWNKQISETDLLTSIVQTLKDRLPRSWDALLERKGPGSPSSTRPDALLRIRSPERTESVLVIEVKRRIDPKDTKAVLDQLRQYGNNPPLVVAPYLGPRTRKLLVEAGSSYADSTGNLRIVLDRPALFIQSAGADSDPWAEQRPLRSLKGPTAGRVVRALCDFGPPYGIRELAEKSRTAVASVSRVVELLDREAIVKREGRGPIETVDWPGLLRRWVQDYAFTKSNRLERFIEPRGTNALVSKLTKLNSQYAATGSLAAARLASVAPTRLAQIYVTNVRDVATELGLRQADSGANVILAEPFDDVVFDRSTKPDGIYNAAASQVAADLLTSPGRGPAEGDALIKWMEQNEDVWRS